MLFVYRRRRISHQVLCGGSFREGDDFADRFFAGEEHDHAVDAESDAAVGRRAVGQRVEEKAKAATQLLFGEAEGFEDAFLNILAVAEESGRLSDVLQHQTEHYQEESSRRMKVLAFLANGAVWLLVGGILIAVIFKMWLGYFNMLSSF